MTYAPIAGWYPDPRNAEAQWRWWNGRDWTHETAPRRSGIVAPVFAPTAAPVIPASAPMAPATGRTVYREPAAPSVASPNTPWIWVLAFSVYIFAAIAGTVQGVAIVALPGDSATQTLAAGGALLLGLVPLWVFAELDGRALRARGFEAPSVLWMLALPPLVYFAVRARKLKRVGARSKGPEIALLIVVALQVVGGALGAMFAYSVIQAFLTGGPAIG